MTRVTSTPTKSKASKQHSVPTTQHKHIRQTGSVDQYAIQNGPCSMNFFGAGSLKSDWE